MDFHGVKVAILVNNKLLMYLRDNLPGLFNANKWDFPGGGREGHESPQECAIREVEEEFEIALSPESFVWERIYPAQKDPDQKAYFMVAEIPKEVVGHIRLHEGQRWDLMDVQTFLGRDDVVEVLKDRFNDYIHSR